MKSKVFNGNSLEQCLDAASSELHMEVDSLKYTILEEKRGIFKKNVKISVEYEEKIEINSNDGTVKVTNGRIVVKNPSADGKLATIGVSPDLKIKINDQEIKGRNEIHEEDKLEAIFPENEAKRYMKIKISDDKVEAVISIEYIPQIIYALKDSGENNYLALETVQKDKVYPPFFSREEIKEELKKTGIKYGIIEENLMKCAETREINNLLIAKGDPAIDDIDDRIELKFEVSTNHSGFQEDETGRVDYKNVGAVSAVKRGDLIAVRMPGKSGIEGKDIFGNILKKKAGRSINLRAGGGCILKDENNIAAAIDGKPCIKNNVYYVYSVHEVSDDVNIKTGNIQFIGDVRIQGSVLEGMKVEAGNTVEVEKNVENSIISAKGDITVKGNVIMSKISAGGEDVLILRHMNDLKEMKLTVSSMIDTILEIKKFNLLGDKATDGEMVKVLIENKFKTIPKLCIGIIRDSAMINPGNDDEVVSQVREKLLGMATLGLRHFSELDEVVAAVDRKINILKGELSLPVTLKIAYCQDASISSSGDIFITGKGIYVSNIISHKGIFFNDSRSVARGGTLEAEEQIKCGVVGSTGGAATKLAVGEHGHIHIETAYTNTFLSVGGKEFIIEYPSKNVHAFISEEGELIVERLKQ